MRLRIKLFERVIKVMALAQILVIPLKLFKIIEFSWWFVVIPAYIAVIYTGVVAWKIGKAAVKVINESEENKDAEI